MRRNRTPMGLMISEILQQRLTHNMVTVLYSMQMVHTIAHVPGHCMVSGVMWTFLVNAFV
jgi:hypothetical protein